MLAWLTHILPGELWKPVYGLCGLRCVRRLRGQVRIPCHSTRSHKRDVSPCVRWSLLRESNVSEPLTGFEPAPSRICMRIGYVRSDVRDVSPTLSRLNSAALYQLSYNGIEAARETRGRKMPVKPWEEAFFGGFVSETAWQASRRFRRFRLYQF